MIHFDQFGWRFAGSASWAVRDVSLDIGRGEFVTVAGPSGSGKTTLALAMCGLLVGRHAGDTRGSVQVSGQDVATTPLHRTAQTIGLVQQNPETHFATLTVSDEIAFGMENRCLGREEIRERSTGAMQLMSITHLRDRSLSTLSGGEKQRVAVASILAGNPEALVLDEPTASLDPETSRDLFYSLADLCRLTGLTVVIIEHKLAHLLPLRPRLICLEEGRVQMDAPDGAVNGTCPAWLKGPGPVRVDKTIARSSDHPITDRLRSRSHRTPAWGDPIVDMSHVTVEFDGRAVLDNISLKVGAGEVAAVLGPNGGGKTTLLHCLLGLVQPVHGSIRVCDMAVSPPAVSRLAGRIGLVFQNADHQLVADTVWREALFASRITDRLRSRSHSTLKVLGSTRQDDARRLLEQAGLAERREDHPYRLSWGQKRRLNLISAILHQPRLLLLDEPFAGQDWENVAFLLDVICGVIRESPGPAEGRAENRALRHNRPAEKPIPQKYGACLMVTHDPRIVLRRCTRILFVSKGRVIVDAPVPQAFDRLLEMGHEAYVPAECLPASHT